MLARNTALTGGLALAIAAAVTVLVSSCQPASRPSTLTVAPVGPGAPVGLIGHGTIDGKPWRFRLMPSGHWDGLIGCQSAARFAQDCAAGFPFMRNVVKWPDSPKPDLRHALLAVALPEGLHLRAVEVEVGAGRRGAALVLVARAVDGRAVRVLG